MHYDDDGSVCQIRLDLIRVDFEILSMGGVEVDEGISIRELRAGCGARPILFHGNLLLSDVLTVLNLHSGRTLP